MGAKADTWSSAKALQVLERTYPFMDANRIAVWGLEWRMVQQVESHVSFAKSESRKKFLASIILSIIP